jgi:hypothetical protein
MLNRIKTIFSKRKKPKYKSVSDFMLHASAAEQEKVMRDAAHKSNKDQMEIFKKAKLLRLKTR